MNPMTSSVTFGANFFCKILVASLWGKKKHSLRNRTEENQITCWHKTFNTFTVTKLSSVFAESRKIWSKVDYKAIDGFPSGLE